MSGVLSTGRPYHPGSQQGSYSLTALPVGGVSCSATRPAAVKGEKSREIQIPPDENPNNGNVRREILLSRCLDLSIISRNYCTTFQRDLHHYIPPLFIDKLNLCFSPRGNSPIPVPCLLSCNPSTTQQTSHQVMRWDRYAYCAPPSSFLAAALHRSHEKIK